MRKFVVLLLGLVLLAGVFAVPQQAQLVIWADDTRAPVLRDVGAAYTAATGVTVEVVEIAFGDLRGQFITAAPTGQGPDILIGAHDWVGELAANGLIEPFDPALGGKANDFNPVGLEAFSYGGKLYGLPYGTENVALIYNKALVPNPPKTWCELLQIARGLTDPAAGRYGYIVQNPDPYHWFPMLSAAGGYIFGKNPDGSLNYCDIGLANDGAIYGATIFDKMIEEGLLPAGVNWDTMTGLFFGGNAGMVISGPWLLGGAKRAGINYGVAPIPDLCCCVCTCVYNLPCPVCPPCFPPKPFAGVQGFMVSAFSGNKTIAFDFLLKYIVTKETMLALYRRDPRPPAYLPALNDPEVQGNPDIAAFGEQAKLATPMPNIPQMSSVWSAWSDAQALIANQQAEPEAALQEAVTKIKAALGCP
ncbi:MAG: sugar ABC transporter substrate-binding protein [Candidatus Bipolaricaulia bacterium]